MSNMNALAITEFGQPAKLIQRPIPKPGPGEVQIKVSSVGCKISDEIMSCSYILTMLQ